MAYESPPPSSPASAEDQGSTLQADPDVDQKLLSKNAPKQNQPPSPSQMSLHGRTWGISSCTLHRCHRGQGPPLHSIPLLEITLWRSVGYASEPFDSATFGP